MSKRQSNATMQSEIFIVLMIVMVLLFIITSFYISKLKQHQQPPLIVLDEAHGYSFSSSSATLNNEFTLKLESSVLLNIQDFAKTYKCDVIEVYGYTDGQPFSRNTLGGQFFDKELHKCLVDGCNIDTIQASSNLELGMKRAVSVVKFLKEKLIVTGSTIKTIRPYSGGAFINAQGKIAKVDAKRRDKFRRRIEIRLSRSHDLRSFPAK
jgi:flagellar motor protein MotB